MKMENNAHAWMLQHVENIRSVDDYVFEIQLHTENRMFLHMLSAEQCSIVNEDEAGGLIEQGLFNYIKVMKICSF